MATDDEVLLEMIEVGWAIWSRNSGDPDEQIKGGTVVAIERDGLGVLGFEIVDSFHGRTRFYRLEAEQIDPTLSQLPNAKTLRSHARRMQAEVAQSRGAMDGWQFRLTSTALLLMEIAA